MAEVPFQGYEAGWADIVVMMLGRPVVGITKVNRTVGQTKENLYGAGSEPIARGKGNKTYKGELEMYGSEARALKSLAGPGKGIHDIGMFTITITTNVGGIVEKETLKNCEFEGDIEKMIAQGDTHQKVRLPFIYAKEK